MAEKPNVHLASIRSALEAELSRQHDASGVHGLVVGHTDEEGCVHVSGPLDVEALTRAMLGAAYRSVVGYDPFEDDPTTTQEEAAQLLCEVLGEAERSASCAHDNASLTSTGDGTPVLFCPDCGTNRLA